MNVSDVAEVLERIAPTSLACEWDNVGLLIGSPRWKVSRILLTIDLTAAVLREALDTGVSFIVSYHPPIFHPLKSLTEKSEKNRIALECAMNRIAVYSPHTALDAAPGGVNDWLADGLGQGDRRALQPHASIAESQQNKLITFCPASTVDAIRNGLATIGAGRIGDYQLCSFELLGTGTFLGGENTNPAVGRPARFERVDEVRLEMVCPTAALALAVTVIRQLHPYEEPLIEIYPLLPHPLRNIGEGRRIVLDRPATLRIILQRIKAHLGLRTLHVAPPLHFQITPTNASVSKSWGATKHQTIGLCAGSGSSLLEAALSQDCTIFLTGELRHHEVLQAQSRCCAVILAGHTNTERGYLPVLKSTLARQLPRAAIDIARTDADPLHVV